MTPIELLKKELATLKRDLSKSVDMFQAGKIDSKLHSQHKENIQPKIDSYRRAIALLEDDKFLIHLIG
jgi:hypothetical protein